jgi:hypothetical protein
MTDSDRKFNNPLPIGDEERERTSPPSMSEMAFKDRWEGVDLMAEIKKRFGDFEIDWTELEPLITNRPALVSRISELTGMTKNEVSKKLDRAEKSIL